MKVIKNATGEIVDVRLHTNILHLFVEKSLRKGSILAKYDKDDVVFHDEIEVGDTLKVCREGSIPALAYVCAYENKTHSVIAYLPSSNIMKFYEWGLWSLV